MQTIIVLIFFTINKTIGGFPSVQNYCGCLADLCGCPRTIVGAHRSIVGARTPTKVYKLTPVTVRCHRSAPCQVSRRGQLVIAGMHRRRSLEGIAGVIGSEACHSKADISVIRETQLFKSIDTLFQKFLFYIIQHLSHITCSTGNSLAGTPVNCMLNIRVTGFALHVANFFSMDRSCCFLMR